VAVFQAGRPSRIWATSLKTAVGKASSVVCPALVLAWLAAVALAVAVAGYKLFLLAVPGPGQVVGGPVVLAAAVFGSGGAVLLAVWGGSRQRRGGSSHRVEPGSSSSKPGSSSPA
jgi:hypothetical protein